MKKVRSSMLIFSYQLRNIGVGKHNMGKRIKAAKPELEHYGSAPKPDRTVAPLFPNEPKQPAAQEIIIYKNYT